MFPYSYMQASVHIESRIWRFNAQHRCMCKRKSSAAWALLFSHLKVWLQEFWGRQKHWPEMLSAYRRCTSKSRPLQSSGQICTSFHICHNCQTCHSIIMDISVETLQWYMVLFFCKIPDPVAIKALWGCPFQNWQHRLPFYLCLNISEIFFNLAPHFIRIKIFHIDF